MSDNLAGVQRHSSAGFWQAYSIIVIGPVYYNGASDKVSFDIFVQRGKDENKRHDVFKVRHNQLFKNAVLVPEEDSDWWLEQCINHGQRISALFKVSAPDVRGGRMMYDMRNVPLGMICDLGKVAHNQFENLTFLSMTTGHYFRPQMTGWLKEPGSGRCIVAVNEPSEGPRGYHDSKHA